MPPASIPPAARALFNAPSSASMVVSRAFFLMATALLSTAMNNRMKMTINEAIRSVNDDAMWADAGLAWAPVWGSSPLPRVMSILLHVGGRAAILLHQVVVEGVGEPHDLIDCRR